MARKENFISIYWPAEDEQRQEIERHAEKKRMSVSKFVRAAVKAQMSTRVLPSKELPPQTEPGRSRP